MLKFYEALFDEFRGLHNEILKNIDALPPEALDWTPGTGMNSISVLTVHLTGAERYWVGDVVRGDPSFRVRASEFEVRGADAAYLKQRVLDLEEYEKTAFENMGLPELQEERVSPRDGQKVIVGRALLHAMQHSAVHLGHIEILLQQWKQKEAAGQKATE